MRMRGLLIFLAMLCPLTLSAQKVVFSPQWTPRSQFAGYYVALEKGFYKDAGLDVEIRHLGVNSSEDYVKKLESGEVNIIGHQLMKMLVQNAHGAPVVNVLQLTQDSGLWCVGHKALSSPKDLDGLRVAAWKKGVDQFCQALEEQEGINVTWVPFIDGVNLFVYGAVDAMLVNSYSEYISLLLALGDVPSRNILKFSEFGYDCPADGLYVTASYYNDNQDTVRKFVEATKRGWNWVLNNEEEALDICWNVLQQYKILTNRQYQRLMLEKYLELMLDHQSGEMNFAPVKESQFNSMSESLLKIGAIDSLVEYKSFVK